MPAQNNKNKKNNNKNNQKESFQNEIYIQEDKKIEMETQLTDYSGTKIAFGPKILMDPTFAITF